jgi:ADP-ribosylation factor-like protein 8
MKCWDLGGQSQYRAEWGRYTRGCNVIIFVVDANAIDILPDVKIELHRLLEDRFLLLSPSVLTPSESWPPHPSWWWRIRSILNLTPRSLNLSKVLLLLSRSS